MLLSSHTSNRFDLKEVQQSSVRGLIGVVPQDTCLFNDTLLHNIRYGRLDATMEEIEAAAEVSVQGTLDVDVV